MKKTIVIDLFASDSPVELVYGVADLLASEPELTVCLPGPIDFLQTHLASAGVFANHPRLRLIPADEIITNAENPSKAILKKKNSSLVAALHQLQDPSVCGMISAGSTGAVLAGSVLITGRIDGVLTPALAAYLPTVLGEGRYSVLLDCGANVDLQPVQLLSFALLGRALITADYGVEAPTVGLLNLGSEPGKGNAFAKEAYALLEKDCPSFVGNLEGRDLLSGKADVIVCDGFSGNIALKTLEGAVQFLLAQSACRMQRRAESEGERRFAADTVNELSQSYDMNSLKGAMLLGCRKMIVKTHGASNRKTIVNAARQLCSIVDGGYDRLAAKAMEELFAR